MWSFNNTDSSSSTVGEMKVKEFRLALIAGFSAMLILVVIVTVIGLRTIKSLQHDLDIIVSNHMAKIELTMTMYTSARQRIVNMQKLLLIDDPFVRDEHIISLDALAKKFIDARLKMRSMPLSSEEELLLEEQSKLTGQALPFQRDISDLVYQDRISEAQQILIGEAIPAQDKVLTKLEELYRYQQKASSRAVDLGLERQSVAIRLMLLVSGVVLLLGILIAMFVVRRTSYEAAQRERQLAKINRMNKDLKKSAKEKEAAQEKAVQANNAKSTFLANMSHEIRTPLTSIIGFSESLIEADLPVSEQEDAVLTIIDSSKHLLNIINDILDLSKVEADKLEVEQLPVSPVDLLNDINTMAKLQAQEKGIAFHTDYVLPLPDTVVTDSLRIKQILLNVVNNAIKFTHQGGVLLRASYQLEEGAFKFEVIDSGIGVTKDQKKKLFQPFSQADSSTTRQFGGSGLGLHISKKLVEALGGSIHLESEMNKGSHFTILIPAQILDGSGWIESLDQSERNGEAQAYQLPAIKGKVLVADDVEIIQKLIKMYLKRMGADVEIANNGLEAFDMAMENTYDLILMDMQMPVMDGVEAVKTLRERGYDKPIVALTANAMKGDIEKYRQMGCDDYLTKPVKREDFYQKVALYLKQSSDVSEQMCHDASESIDIHPKFTNLLNLFVDQLPDAIATFRMAHKDGHNEELIKESHKLKGLGASFGFPLITEIATQMEKLLELEELDAFEDQIDKLQTLYEQIRLATE